ncbi:MAG: hypothetical protein WAL71_14505 [Terriglobales bacterium]|jgi:hypothetical protein
MNFLKKPRLWSFALYVGLSLTVGMSIAPIPVMAADPQPVIGTWEGTLDPGAQPKKRIVVHISAAEDGSLSGTIDYPEQDISGDPVTAITYKEPALHFESSPSQSVYDGTMNKDNSAITGTFKHAGAPLNLTLKRTP